MAREPRFEEKSRHQEALWNLQSCDDHWLKLIIQAAVSVRIYTEIVPKMELETMFGGFLQTEHLMDFERKVFDRIISISPPGLTFLGRPRIVPKEIFKVLLQANHLRRFKEKTNKTEVVS